MKILLGMNEVSSIIQKHIANEYGTGVYETFKNKDDKGSFPINITVDFPNTINDDSKISVEITRISE
jgi:hypothetical protein